MTQWSRQAKRLLMATSAASALSCSDVEHDELAPELGADNQVDVHTIESALCDYSPVPDVVKTAVPGGVYSESPLEPVDAGSKPDFTHTMQVNQAHGPGLNTSARLANGVPLPTTRQTCELARVRLEVYLHSDTKKCWLKLASELQPGVWSDPNECTLSATINYKSPPAFSAVLVAARAYQQLPDEQLERRVRVSYADAP